MTATQEATGNAHLHPPVLRVLILGATGRLGDAFVHQFSRDPRISLTRLDRHHVDLSDPLQVDAVLERVQFDWLINCAAWTRVDDSEIASAHASLINGHVPGQVARLCAAKGARMVHFSTDYVFDGRKAGYYTEDDLPAPLSAYGKSKLLGERQVLHAGSSHLVIRLSWLFGPGRPGFPEWVLRQAATGEVRVVTDRTGCPTYTGDVVKWVRALLFLPDLPGGIYHLCNPPACTWYDYAAEILRLAGSPVVPVPVLTRDLPGLRAPRPANSALSVERFERLTGLRCRPWREAIADHLAATLRRQE